MRNIILLATLIIVLTSCNKAEEQCGIITDWGIDDNFNYLIWVDGNKHKVNAGAWWDATIGEYTCITYD